MQIQFFQHVHFEGPGSIDAWAAAAGHATACTRFFAGDLPPSFDDVDWLVVLGGPMGANDEVAFPWLREEKHCIRTAIEAGKRVLGICLGAQLMAGALGAAVYPNVEKEIGWFPVSRLPGPFPPGAPADALPADVMAFHWHGDTFDLPDPAVHLARSNACEHQAFSVGDRAIGLQFHLETTCESAAALIENCAADITTGLYIQPTSEMTAHRGRFDDINRDMARLMDWMAR